ncbi:hypothetical protein PIB30_025323 [Stylosanthes scabra]|uniref:Uncharacterized protein n=1 Tax=Stylosanthes scabra TaxID=79078 RepID=A0ABU6W8K1_9FABA|nr:hypothetical protein [Stylosanthes scabra]
MRIVATSKQRQGANPFSSSSAAFFPPPAVSFDPPGFCGSPLLPLRLRLGPVAALRPAFCVVPILRLVCVLLPRIWDLPWLRPYSASIQSFACSALSSRTFFSTGIAIKSPPFPNSASIPSFPLLHPRVLIDPDLLLFLLLFCIFSFSMVCSLGIRRMEVMARFLAAGSFSQSIADDFGRSAAEYICRELHESDEANLLDEEGML